MHNIVSDFEHCLKGHGAAAVSALPCSLSQERSWMKPTNGAMPVPGPIMMTGLLALKGSLNWDLRMYIGTVALCPLSVGNLALSQLVATPLLMRFVLVLYSTTTAQMWMLLGWTCHKRALFSNTHTHNIINERRQVVDMYLGGGRNGVITSLQAGQKLTHVVNGWPQGWQVFQDGQNIPTCIQDPALVQCLIKKREMWIMQWIDCNDSKLTGCNDFF